MVDKLTYKINILTIHGRKINVANFRKCKSSKDQRRREEEVQKQRKEVVKIESGVLKRQKQQLNDKPKLQVVFSDSIISHMQIHVTCVHTC